MSIPIPISQRGPATTARTTSMRTLTKILRPSKARRPSTAQPSLSIPPATTAGETLLASPSLYSLSSESDSRPTLSPETDRRDAPPLLSPTSSNYSSSASEGHGDDRVLSDPAAPDLNIGRTEPISPTDPKFQCSPSADYAWAMHRTNGNRPQRIIISADKDVTFIGNDGASSLRAGGRAQLRPLSPSEWIGSNVIAKKRVSGVAQLSPSESENRSPIASSSSPATPRPRPVSEINRSYAKLAGDEIETALRTGRSHGMTEIPEFEPLTEHRRRARSLSEPRSFLGSAVEMSPHAGTVPSTPTAYIFAADDLGSRPRSSQTITPPPRQSSLVPSPNIRMPEDVYFTAAGRRESRMYISPDAAPNFVPAVSQPPTRRGHSHSNSEPVLLDRQNPAMRHATWSGAKKEPTSGRPFEDVLREEALSGEKDNTPVSRKEDMWVGNWNRDDIQDVIQGLRLLK